MILLPLKTGKPLFIGIQFLLIKQTLHIIKIQMSLERNFKPTSADYKVHLNLITHRHI